MCFIFKRFLFFSVPALRLERHRSYKIFENPTKIMTPKMLSSVKKEPMATDLQNLNAMVQELGQTFNNATLPVSVSTSTSTATSWETISQVSTQNSSISTKNTIRFVSEAPNQNLRALQPRWPGFARAPGGQHVSATPNGYMPIRAPSSIGPSGPKDNPDKSRF